MPKLLSSSRNINVAIFFLDLFWAYFFPNMAKKKKKKISKSNVKRCGASEIWKAQQLHKTLGGLLFQCRTYKGK